MTTEAELLAQITASAVDIRNVHQRLEREVSKARAAGISWRKIADALGVSVSAVHRKYAAHAAATPDQER